MASLGKINVIANDFKTAFDEYGFKDQSKKLNYLVKNATKFNKEKLINNLSKAGYNTDAPVLDRTSLAYEALNNSTAFVFESFDTAYNEIKESKKINLSEETIEALAPVVVIIIFALLVFVICSIIDWNFNVGKTDGLVSVESAYRFYGERDVDTTKNGILSLQLQTHLNSRSENLEVTKINLYIQTPTPTIGKIKVVNKSIEIKPYDFIQFETKGDTVSGIIIELPSSVLTAQWYAK